jgi:outer membrane protein assembly factor BamB
MAFLMGLGMILSGMGWAQPCAPFQLETFVMADLDNDKVPELVYGTRAGCVHVAKKQNNAYQEIWTSNLLKSSIVSVIVADIDADLLPEIIAGTMKGLVVVYSPDGFVQKWDNQFDNLGELNGMLAADIDGKGKMELVVYNNTNLIVYEGGSYFRRWKSENGLGAQKVLVGNVDQAVGRDLVTNTGYVIDPLFYRVTWHYSPGFGADFRLLDMDGDGLEEVIGTQGRDEITVFDLDLRSARIR